MIQETKLDNIATAQSDRVEVVHSGDKNGPAVVLFVGMHGNETAGVNAIVNIINKYLENGKKLEGSLYAIKGNLEALNRGVRYIDTDLNRLWEIFDTTLDYSHANDPDLVPAEYLESLQVKSAIEEILEEHQENKSEIIFADLHTTSAESCAFILLNDTIANRKIARKFPVPQILGIEENIHGTLLSYINNLGYRAIGFEAGAHTAKESVKRSEAFICLLLHYTGLVTLDEKKLKNFESEIKAHANVPDTYFEIKYHHYIDDPVNFNMFPGFHNFDEIEKDTPLAYENGELIKAPVSGRIFMPLYQKIGNDGFLILDEVSPFWLTLSSWIRNSPVHSLLQYLPGVEKINRQVYEVDRQIALFLVKEVFHLMGYRVLEKNEHTYICFRR
jgi:predicted deacylase